MPKKTEQELKQLAKAGEIVGFTLDTTEFHHAGYDFQSKILKALGQFADTDVTLLFSEIVLSEVHAHIRDDMKTKSDQSVARCGRSERRPQSILIWPRRCIAQGFQQT